MRKVSSIITPKSWKALINFTSSGMTILYEFKNSFLVTPTATWDEDESGWILSFPGVIQTNMPFFSTCPTGNVIICGGSWSNNGQAFSIIVNSNSGSQSFGGYINVEMY